MPESSAKQPSYKDLTGHVRKISDLYFAYGGFSEVFKGTYQDGSGLQRSVAIKVIRGTRMTPKIQDVILHRLDREASVWHSLKHPNVLEFLGIARNFGPSVALVAPYCANGHATKYLDDYPQANRLHLILGVAKGIEYLHSKNVIHGDIKGHNVLVADDGTALLCDFGRSRIINHRGFTTLFAAAVRYLAPELIVKGAEVPGIDEEIDESFDPQEFMSKESDVYAFSMVGVEILSGEVPYPKIHNGARIILRVPEGLRPKREEYRLSKLHGKIWDILELCWVNDFTGRPTMIAVVQHLSKLK
ncbi:hypothetical protein APHAL10511_003063 [Amanita phalloides]|nr:hypothetical protein APHAL10511_003063 [Amanita phalloides]